MAKKGRSLRQLADESNIDLDEVLVKLWSAGFEHLRDPSDKISHRQLDRARYALGIVTKRDISSLRYWQELMCISEQDLTVLLQHLGTPLSPRAHVLPKGAVAKLKAEARKRRINPLTGVIDSVTNSRAVPIASTPSVVPHTLSKVPERPESPSSGIVAESQTFRWKVVGHWKDDLRWLTEAEVVAIHHELVRDFDASADPISPYGVRDKHILGSAVFRPHTALHDILKYPTAEMSASALLHSIIQDHPFHNGNKRTALVSMLVVMDENGLFPICHEDELFKLILQIAKHEIVQGRPSDLADREVLWVARWLCDHSRVLEKGERPLAWRMLKRVLRSHGCRHEIVGGNRINISRDILETGAFGRKKVRTLATQVSFGDDGRDVEVNTIKKIRQELHLDDMHGIDSQKFYGQQPALPGDFIARYRKTLHRLAKF